MSDKEARKKLSIEKLKKTHYVGKGKTEHLKTKMGSKTGGFTEHIDDVLRVSKSGPDIMAKNKAISTARKTAKAIRMGKVSKVTQAVSSVARRAASKLPSVLGMVAGPAMVLATGGNVQEAAASVVDADALGEGSDEVGDMKLSRAERLRAERRALAARGK